MKKINAFSLAEILLTLIVIGTISMLTIPPLMANVNEKAWISGLHKAKSALNQIVSTTEMKYGPAGISSNFSEKLYDEMKANMNTTGRGVKRSTNDKTWIKDPTDSNTNMFSDGGIETMDGMHFNFTAGNNYCAMYGVNVDETDCVGVFEVDVNGYQKPNIQSKDAHFFLLTKNDGIVPAGRDDNSDCLSVSNATTCTYKFMMEGKVKYNSHN